MVETSHRSSERSRESLKVRATKVMEIQERMSREQQKKERATDQINKETIKERGLDYNSRWNRTKRSTKKVLISTTLMALSLGSSAYSIASDYYRYYMSPEDKPVISLINAIDLKNNSIENILMIEYINKNTNKLEAEFKTVAQKGKVETNTVLLNGVTDNGYWYQGGIRISRGNVITLHYDIWDDKNNDSVNVSFDKPVKIGDRFNISLEIDNGVITLKGKDLD